MADDLMTKIYREVAERMKELRGAVEERDRLQAELRELDAHRESPVDLEVPAQPVPEVSVDTESSGTIIRFPPVRDRARRPLVSPKVVRLMLEPTRPALEGNGLDRVAL
jgi:hypothetical protein